MIFDRDGPASYVNTGTFGTSGDAFSVLDIGMGGIEDLGADMMSSDGVNVVEVVLGQNVAAGTFTQSKGIPAVVASIHWFTSPTRGTEVINGTNLSSKFIRLRAVLV
jgi:hypothetical protein